MKKAMRSVLLVALTMVALCGVAQAKNLLVGVQAPLTGNSANDGNDILRGATAAVEAFGAMPGYDKIEIISGDDACDPRQAVAVANKLASSKVAGVVGSYCSGSTIPASEVLDQENIPMITPASTNPKVTERGLKYMYRICGRDDQQGPAAVKFAKEVLGAKTIAIVDDKTTYSQGLADVVNKTATEMGIKVVLHDHVNEGDKDYSAVLTKIKKENPDVYYVSLQSNTTGADMLKQARNAGITAKFISQDALFHPKLIEDAGPAAQGAYFTFGYADKNSPTYKKFAEAYAKQGAIGSYSAYAYDSMMVLLSAIKTAGSTDAAKIKDAISKMDMSGASKQLKFDAKGDSGSDYIIYEAKGKEYVPFWNPATGKKF